jgi:terminase large subunit-like protein
MSSSLKSLAYRLDPVQMAKGAGLELDPWQARLARSQAKKILVNCSRQTGKSTTVSAIADHTAFYKKASTTLLLSPSLRQSGELFRKCLEVYHALGSPINADAESALRLELEGGSRIVSLPGKEGTIRGISKVDLLIIDEASRVPDSLYKSVRPMLAVSGGRIILLSTPFGTRGFYYEEYKNRHKWDYYEIPATKCPRISSAFLEEEKESMGEWWFLQEYMCQFMDSESAAFRSEDIEQIVKPEVETWSF